MTERVITACWADWKNVKTRGVIQLVFEAPVEQTEEVLKMLGAPIPGQEKWVAIAVLEAPRATEPERPRKHWEQLGRPQRAGILCSDPGFWNWAQVGGEDEAITFLRAHCGVKSRSELDVEPAAAKFDALVASYRADTGQMAERR